MSFQSLRAALVRRLDEGRDGAHGWWLLTRVHLDASRLQSIVSYLYDAGAEDGLELRRQHYHALARILDIRNDAPWVGINRHYFLALETPLRLFERIDGVHWTNVRLTPAGVRLATGDNPVEVFETTLRAIRFCREPWYTATRVSEYRDFDIRPYPTTLAVMRQNGGYIDIDDFDLFVSRIRKPSEIRAASDHVAEFRTLDNGQKAALRREVEQRISAGSTDRRKPYSNWRDMARHTFSLFSVGQSAYRSGNELLLSRTLAVEAESTPTVSRGTGARRHTTSSPSRNPRIPTILRIPHSEAPLELLTPPALPQADKGGESELLIGKILAAAGWRVLYYNRRRGFGFDLWAQKENQAFVIEVKSFLEVAGSVVLTSLEYEAAQHHEGNYLLAVVEHASSDTPTVYVIQNPAGSVTFAERRTAEFSAPRSAWKQAARDGFPGDDD